MKKLSCGRLSSGSIENKADGKLALLRLCHAGVKAPRLITGVALSSIPPIIKLDNAATPTLYAVRAKNAGVRIEEKSVIARLSFPCRPISPIFVIGYTVALACADGIGVGRIKSLTHIDIDRARGRAHAPPK